MVEPRIVVPDVAGSNPVGHPSEFFIGNRFYRENHFGVKGPNQRILTGMLVKQTIDLLSRANYILHRP